MVAKKKSRKKNLNKDTSVAQNKILIPKRSRIKTGVTNLDPLMQGGLKQHSVTLIVGSTGSGKTIFALQFLLEGLKKGESCLYITFEEKKNKLYDDMSAFGWNLAKFEEQKKFFYLEYNPEQVKSLIEEGGGSVDPLIEKHKVTRIVIDSVTSFSLLYQDELAKKEAGLALFDLIEKWGCTAVLTVQGFGDDKNIHSSLEFEADSIILLYHFKEKGKRERALEILKMRGTSHTNKTISAEITNSGLKVKPSKVVYVK